VVEIHDLTDPSQDGWAFDYPIRRETARNFTPRFAAGPRHTPLLNGQRTPKLSRRSAIEGSRLHSSTRTFVESPATRGAVMISIWFDPVDEGKLCRRVSYERAPG
jgi:hypothetical protein